MHMVARIRFERDKQKTKFTKNYIRLENGESHNRQRTELIQ